MILEEEDEDENEQFFNALDILEEIEDIAIQDEVKKCNQKLEQINFENAETIQKIKQKDKQKLQNEQQQLQEMEKQILEQNEKTDKFQQIRNYSSQQKKRQQQKTGIYQGKSQEIRKSKESLSNGSSPQNSMKISSSESLSQKSQNSKKNSEDISEFDQIVRKKLSEKKPPEEQAKRSPMLTSSSDGKIEVKNSLDLKKPKTKSDQDIKTNLKSKFSKN